MVRKGRVVLITIPLIALGGVVFFWPDLIVERSDPYVRLVTRAAATYFAEHGRYPASFTEVQSYLAGGTVSRVGDDNYKIEIIDSETQQVCVLEARYKVDANGGMEELYARVIDKRRK
jgi:hypothetical protein